MNISAYRNDELLAEWEGLAVPDVGEEITITDGPAGWQEGVVIQRKWEILPHTNKTIVVLEIARKW